MRVRHFCRLSLRRVSTTAHSRRPVLRTSSERNTPVEGTVCAGSSQAILLRSFFFSWLFFLPIIILMGELRIFFPHNFLRNTSRLIRHLGRHGTTCARCHCTSFTFLHPTFIVSLSMPAYTFFFFFPYFPPPMTNCSFFFFFFFFHPSRLCLDYSRLGSPRNKRTTFASCL